MTIFFSWVVLRYVLNSETMEEINGIGAGGSKSTIVRTLAKLCSNYKGRRIHIQVKSVSKLFKARVAMALSYCPGQVKIIKDK